MEEPVAKEISPSPSHPPTLPPLSMRAEVQEHLSAVLGNALEATCPAAEMMEQLLGSLATPPALTTLRVNSLRYRRETVMAQLQDILVKQYSERSRPPPPVLPHPLLDDIIVIPNTGPRHDVHPQGKIVVVGEQCGMAVLRGADVFAPGLMGAPRDLRRGDCVSVYADLDGRCKRGLAVEYEGRTLFVGNGIARLSRRELFSAEAQNSGVAVQMTEALYSAPMLNSELVDAMFLQNLPSILTSLVLDPHPGETVLDMCAAPGGKTVHIATLMNDQGCVIALDKTRPKVTKLTENVKRFNLACVHSFAFDATRALGPTELHRPPTASAPSPPPYPPESFDRVLLDAPCSAMGQRPQAVCRQSLKELLSYPPYQQKLLSQAIGLLKPGGTLVYSTCTFTPEENESQVEWVMRNHPQMKIVDQEPYLGTSGIGSVTEVKRKVQRFWPSSFLRYLHSHSDETVPTDHRYLGRCGGIDLDVCPVRASVSTEALQDTIGFFIAKFVKSAPEAN